LRPEERGFGMVFQNYALFPHMNVRRNIGFGLKMRGLPKAEIDKRVDEAVALVRLQSQVEKLPGQLSGGQQQRVAIARAIVVEPPLVLMDEPLSNLDAKLRLEMRAEIRRIHNTLGATTIYVTHDQEEALSLADRIVVLRDGEVRQVGTPEDLFSRPDLLDVAEFMGFRNVVAGRITSAEGGMARVAVGPASVGGRSRGSLVPGAAGHVAIRPEDLQPVAAGEPGLKATVISTEFRGREFVGFARMEDGTDLSFLAHDRLEPGDVVTLGAEPDRVLVFGGAA
jgi:putative spermidine/putrescine transport system ATP-binding protein